MYPGKGEAPWVLVEAPELWSKNGIIPQYKNKGPR